MVKVRNLFRRSDQLNWPTSLEQTSRWSISEPEDNCKELIETLAVTVPNIVQTSVAYNLPFLLLLPILILPIILKNKPSACARPFINARFVLGANKQNSYEKYVFTTFDVISLPGTQLSNNISCLADYFYLVDDILSINFTLTNMNIVLVPDLEKPFSSLGIVYIR